jgi:hypothetical protein
MSDDVPSNATVVDTLADLCAQYKALKKLEPRTDDEARRRSSELIRLGRIIDEAKRQATVANAEQRVANGSSDGGVTAANLSGEIIAALAKSVAPAIRGLHQKVTSLEQRIKPVEGRRSGTYQGEWSEKKFYQPGDFCNVGGTMWKCRRANMGMAPGISSAWELGRR